MNNRELLENAAKAAGINWVRVDDVWYDKETGRTHNWNPLESDADAFRLAVKLNLALTPYPIYDNPKHSVLAQLKNLDDSKFEVMELHGIDKYAATRRAIVRAAAEIGKNAA